MALGWNRSKRTITERLPKIKFSGSCVKLVATNIRYITEFQVGLGEKEFDDHVERMCRLLGRFGRWTQESFASHGWFDSL
ncbi:hypothetical protein TNCT_642171 [Trichonephila clavata]|uniref:Uncharacterized protein n=1 Tax=Trichonephila clavata TaxID=2740835 RepID=A0A8X6F435_TRICU|nr:hypothetical protein TNCT_642171 [Trichonephila clavata]